MDTPLASGVGGIADEIRALANRREWRAVAERASFIAPEDLVRDSETAFHYADALWHIGEHTRALALAEQIEPAVRRTGSRRLVLNLINVIGICLFLEGRTTEAEQRFAELLERSTRWGDPEFCGRASNNLGALANLRAEHEHALAYYQRAAAAYHQVGYLLGLAQTHHNLGLSYRDLGFLDDADAHFRRAIEFAGRADAEDVIALAESERALLRVGAGDAAIGEVLSARAMERFERCGDPLGRAEAMRVRAAAARAQGRDDDAAAWLDEVLSVAQPLGDALLVAEARRDRGILLRDQGRVREAREMFAQAAATFERLGAAGQAAEMRSLADRL